MELQKLSKCDWSVCNSISKNNCNCSQCGMQMQPGWYAIAGAGTGKLQKYAGARITKRKK